LPGGIVRDTCLVDRPINFLRVRGVHVADVLPKMLVSEDAHSELYRFIRHHPELIEVFHNVVADRPLQTGVLLAHSADPEIIRLYIENLHLPLLIQNEAIRVSKKHACGYEALVSGLSFMGYDPVSAAEVSANRATALAQVASKNDHSKNSLYCYYHGLGDSVRASEALLEELRQVILKYASNPGVAEAGEQETAFDLIISGRITRYEKA